MKNFIDSLDEWLYNEMGLMGGSCSSINSLKYTTARTALEKLLKEIQKEKEIKSFEDCTFYMTSSGHTKPKCIPDGLYIIHESLGLSMGGDWNSENNEGVIGILSVVGDETLVISLETEHQTITPNVDFSQYQTDAKKRLPTVREFEKFFKICRLLIQAFQDIFPDNIPHAYSFRVLGTSLSLTRFCLWNDG